MTRSFMAKRQLFRYYQFYDGKLIGWASSVYTALHTSTLLFATNFSSPKCKIEAPVADKGHKSVSTAAKLE
jgi:hypothetical protein